jgi:O-antigen ligase
MLSESSEKALVNFLYLGSAAITVFVITGAVTDPVNATKHFLLGGVAFAVFAIAIISRRRILWQDHKVYLAFSASLFLFSVSATLNSAAPLVQNLYGVYGRNTGLIAYLSFLLLALATLTLRRKVSFEKVLVGLFIAGIVNVFYCLWAWQVGDFIGWNNPYNTILGTFGNPNFIGAFLGIFLTTLVAYSLGDNRSVKFRIAAGIILVVGFLEIQYSNAVQGIVVTAAGLSLIGFYVIRDRFKSAIPLAGYTIFVALLGVLSTLGALQIGPLKTYIYKNSVSLRGEYWQAGVNMAREKPFTGVGMDSYGDWYRRLRDTQALVMPGPNTVTNAAHNVNFDVLAYGGWPLFISYLGLVCLTLISILKMTLRLKKYDPIFVALTVGWVCYQIQALISINQIGLAIWGWILGGAIVAYEVTTRVTSKVEPVLEKKQKSRTSNENFSPQLIGGLGLVLGFLVAVPPLSADMSWRSALQSQQIEKVQAALEPGYMQPLSSARLANAVQLLEQSNLPDLAYSYAKKGVEFNPDYFDAWKVLYFISKSTQADKDLALMNMQRLDPNNKNVLDIPKA